MKAHYYTNLVECGRTTQGDALFEESALNEVVWQFSDKVTCSYVQNTDLLNKGLTFPTVQQQLSAKKKYACYLLHIFKKLFAAPPAVQCPKTLLAAVAAQCTLVQIEIILFINSILIKNMLKCAKRVNKMIFKGPS